MIETGASRVNKHLLDALLRSGHTVSLLGVSHFFGEDYDHEKYPYDVVPVNGWEEASDWIVKNDGLFDMLFISADMHHPNLLLEHVKKYPSIVLGAIDGEVKYAEQVVSFAHATIPSVYSEFAYNQVLGVMPEIRDKLVCTQLGCEPDIFYPLSNDERRAYRKKAFNIEDDTFLVGSFNRNQPRKDLARCMKAFQLFHERVPNSRLYMHAKREDVGGNLITQARLLGVDMSSVIWTPDEYNEIFGFDRYILNRMYNACDVCISCARGGGWELTTTECMAAGTPFIGPKNTTFFEILGEEEEYCSLQHFSKREHGYLVDSGGDNLWDISYSLDDTPRPLTNTYGMWNALHHVYSKRKEAQSKALLARNWALEHTWEQFEARWRDIFLSLKGD